MTARPEADEVRPQAGEARPKAGKVVGGMAWTMSSAAVQMVMQVAVLTLLARLLTPEDFGVVAAATVVVNFAAIFTQLGVNQALVQRQDLTPGVVATGFWLSAVFAAVLASALALLAPLVAGQLGIPESAAVLRALAAGLLVRGLAATSEALLTRAMRFRAIAVIEVASYAFGYGVVGLVLAASGMGVWALVGAHLSQTALRSAMTLALQRHGLRADLSAATLAGLLRFGSGYSVARIANFVALQADNLIVARGLGATALGVYSRAYQLMGMPAGLIGGAIDRVLFPSLSRIQGEERELARSYLRAAATIALLTVPVGVVLSVLAGEVVAVLLGGQWRDVVGPLQVFALTMVLRVTDRLNAVVARAKAVVFRRALLQVVYACCIVAFALLGLRFGLSGVVIGVTLALLTNHLASTALSLAIVGESWRRLLAAAMAAAPLTLLCGSLSLAVATALRLAAAPDIVTLLAALGAAGAAALTAVMRFPRLFLGDGAAWLLRSTASLLPDRLADRLGAAAARAESGG